MPGGDVGDQQGVFPRHVSVAPEVKHLGRGIRRGGRGGVHFQQPDLVPGSTGRQVHDLTDVRFQPQVLAGILAGQPIAIRLRWRRRLGRAVGEPPSASLFYHSDEVVLLKLGQLVYELLIPIRH